MDQWLIECVKINRYIKALKSSLDGNNGPKAKHYLSRLFFHYKACLGLYALIGCH